MSYGNLELAELVCTRISHDLGGNIGAISSALELINDSDGVIDDITEEILRTGTQTLTARQKFFRVAFGLDTIKISANELKKICEDYLASIVGRGSTISLKFENISEEVAKPICLCVMLAGDIFIKGGEISISLNAKNMQIRATTDYKFSISKLSAYQEIISGGKVSENVSQYVHLLCLQEFVGDDVPLNLRADEKEMELIVG